MRNNIEVIRVLKLHPDQILPQQVLAPQVHAVWKMVNFLVLVEHQDVLNGGVACPNQIEVRTSFKHLKSAIFHGIYHSIVNMSPVRVEKTHKKVFYFAPSIIGFYSIFIVSCIF